MLYGVWSYETLNLVDPAAGTHAVPESARGEPFLYLKLGIFHHSFALISLSECYTTGLKYPGNIDVIQPVESVVDCQKECQANNGCSFFAYLQKSSITANSE